MSGCIHNCDVGGICLAEHAGYPKSCPKNSQVPAQDSLGTALGESLCGKSEAAQRASERTLADADLNDGTPAGQTGIEVVTAGETATNPQLFDAREGRS